MTEKEIIIDAENFFVEGMPKIPYKYPAIVGKIQEQILTDDIKWLPYEYSGEKASESHVIIESKSKSMQLKNDIDFVITWTRKYEVGDEYTDKYTNPKFEHIKIGSGTPVYSYASNCVRGVCNQKKRYYVKWSEIVKPPPKLEPELAFADFTKSLREESDNEKKGGKKKSKKSRITNKKSKKSKKSKSTKKRT